MPVNPVFFQDRNRLNFRFTGRYTPDCNDPLSGLLWSTVSDTSTLTLTLDRLPPQRDLARLPLPFFDLRARRPAVAAVRPGGNPSNESLQAPAIVASWFGKLADFRGAQLPGRGRPPRRGQRRAGRRRRPTCRPASACRRSNGPDAGGGANPNDPLAIAAGGRRPRRGRGGGGRHHAVAGQPRRWAATPPRCSPARRAAPQALRRAGLDPDRPAGALRRTGRCGRTCRAPATCPAPSTCRSAPRPTSTPGATGPFPGDVRFRAPPGPVIDVAASRLDVGINGIYPAQLPARQRRRPGTPTG